MTFRQRVSAFVSRRPAVALEQKPRGNGRSVQVPMRLWPDYRNERPIWNMVDLSSYIESGYNLNAAIYAAATYRADAVNTAKLRAYQGNADKSVPLPETHPLALLLKRPNPYQSAHEFNALNSVFFSLAGQSFIWFKRDRATEFPTEMHTLRPDWVKIVPSGDRDNPVIGFIYTPGGGSMADGIPLLPENVMHAKRPNPGDPLVGAGYGFSPMGPLAQSGNVDNDVTKFLKIFFQSGAMFQNLITFEGEHTKEDLAEARQYLNDIYGGVENWGKWGAVGDSAKVTRLTPTFDEMGFEAIDSRNEARILMALGVPPILIGSRFGLLSATYANYDLARRAFWEDRLLPELNLFEGEFQHFLNQGDVFVKYDTSDAPALRRDVPALTEAANTLFKMGVPARTAFITVGLEVGEYDGDQERYVNTGTSNALTPAAVAPTSEQATEVVTTAPTKARKVSYDAPAMGRKMDTLAVNWEKRYGDKAVELFKQEQREISAMINEMQHDAYRRKQTPNWRGLLLNIEQYYSSQGFAKRPEVWREAFVPLLSGTMTEAGKEWAAALGVQFDVRNLAGEAWFQDYTLKFANPITEGSSAAIHELLSTGMAEGWTIPETQKALGMLFNQWMEGTLNPTDWEFTNARLPAYRRENIARTESMRAENSGSFELGKQWGVKRKAWFATNDTRTRENHAQAAADYGPDGIPGPIPIDQDFIVGEVEMAYPGDPKGTPEEFCQCRCTVLLYMD